VTAVHTVGLSATSVQSDVYLEFANSWERSAARGTDVLKVRTRLRLARQSDRTHCTTPNGETQLTSCTVTALRRPRSSPKFLLHRPSVPPRYHYPVSVPEAPTTSCLTLKRLLSITVPILLACYDLPNVDNFHQTTFHGAELPNCVHSKPKGHHQENAVIFEQILFHPVSAVV
jgi:hypothetical protein